MAGLIDPQHEAALAPGAAPPQMSDPSGQLPDTVPDDAGTEATPEEQAAYEEFVKTGFGLMYAGGEVKPEILAMLDEDPADLMAVLENAEELQQFSPVVALAAAAAIITLKVCEETKEQDGAVIFHGGKAILEDLVEIAGKAGLTDYSEEEMGQAFRMAADLFREAGVEAGIVHLDQAKEEWNELVAADKDGRLGEFLPELDKVNKQQAQMPMEGADGPA